jgi:aminoglycoside phosphotransferase (APT) family kinase protein
MTEPTLAAGAQTARPITGIDAAPVTDWLAEHARLRGPLRFTRIGGGQSNLTYRVDDADGRSAVLRRPPMGEVLQSAHDMSREYTVIERLAGAGMPVPEPFALCEDAAVTGAPFYVMAHVDGTIVTTPQIAEGMSVAARRAAGLSMADTLAKLQSVDLDAHGFGEMRRPREYCDRQLRRWRKQWEGSKTRELPVVDELADRLAAASPAETETVLVHGDYRIDNAVLDESGSIIAVLDWELSTVGHPLADVGLMLVYWEEARTPQGLFRSTFTLAEGFPSVQEIVDRYGETTGRPVGDVDFFVAFAYWKIAVICEGVYRRWLNDPSNGAESAGTVGEAVERLATLADTTARRAGI